jgi:hypothetical protein
MGNNSDKITSPLNKHLGYSFLKQVIDILPEHNKEPEHIKNYFGDWYSDKESDKYYDNFQTNITYNKESFNIKVVVTDKKLFEPKKSYKEFWKWCYEYKAPEGFCCEDDFNYELNEEQIKIEEKNKKEWEERKEKYCNINMLSYNTLKKYMRSTDYKNCDSDSDCYSGPYKHTYISGAQYNWNFCFMCSLNDLHVFIMLSPVNREVYRKYVSGYTMTNKGNILNIEEETKIVNNYIPDNLWFDDDFYIVLKNIKINDIINYKDKTLKLLDYKFCNVSAEDRYCGCFISWCSDMSVEEGFEKIPTKSTYDTHFTCSCTPEWYLQVQIRECNTYKGYCARFIFEFV